MAGDPPEIASSVVYSAGMILTYGASTCYHGSRNLRRKHWLRRLDHASIYLFIAATYTPFLAVTLAGSFGHSLLATVWSLAAAGFGVKIAGARLPEPLSVGSYLALGWLCLAAIRPLLASLPAPAFALLVAGGIAYTAGVFFFLRDHRRFHHAIWHLCVMLGSTLHFLAILLYVRSPQP